MVTHAFCGGLEAPVGKYLEILQAALKPDSDVKQIDLCCGLGFGKTLLAIQAAALTLNIDGNQRGLFLEPDWDRVNDIFLPMWEKYVPEDLYEIQVGKNRINWYNGAYLIFRPRVITGSKERSRGKFRGIEFSFVIDDETAIGFDREQYQNTLARIRIDSPVRYYFTLSTPLVGPYGRFIKREGNTLFRGRTRDNHYLLKRDPDYEKRQRQSMGVEQARRELDGELVALEGRIWKTAEWEKYDPNEPKNKDYAWPDGNRHDTFTKFRKDHAWYLFCDLGGATGSYVVVQKTEAEYRGRRLFKGPVWVAVADLCPINDSSADRAFGILKRQFGTPAGIVAGQDTTTRESGSGRTMAFYAQRHFGNVRIYPCSERNEDRQIQYDSLSYLMHCIGDGHRRFTIARDFESLEKDSERGVREMILEDAWPAQDKIREGDILPKNKEITVQHTRDALLNGTMMIMNPPAWVKTRKLAG